jgi:putative NIF3 family GTP cyclohydrolase 1 type 2
MARRPTELSRRRFVQLSGAAAAAPVATRAADAPSAQTIVQRVQAALGGEWLTDGVDGFKAGDPSTPVSGIATTAMATLNVLKMASAAGANLIFSYEPTFFGRHDGPTPPLDEGARRYPGLSDDDPVYLAKKDFIETNGLVVYRLHDKWLARQAPAMTAGLAEALGWADRRVGSNEALYEIPPASAERTVARIRDRLKLRGGLRAVGDRAATVRRVLLFPGFMDAATMWAWAREADLILTGEVREWENTFYAADLFTAGEKRALVTIGRVASEDPGMQACAGWLAKAIPDVPTRFIPAGDLYWRAA